MNFDQLTYLIIKAFIKEEEWLLWLKEKEKQYPH